MTSTIKSTGIVRKVDLLGRVVIPKEIRSVYNFVEEQEVEFYVENNRIIIGKYHKNCIFCNSDQNLIVYEDKLICGQCVGYINKNMVLGAAQ